MKYVGRNVFNEVISLNHFHIIENKAIITWPTTVACLSREILLDIIALEPVREQSEHPHKLRLFCLESASRVNECKKCLLAPSGSLKRNGVGELFISPLRSCLKRFFQSLHNTLWTFYETLPWWTKRS